MKALSIFFKFFPILLFTTVIFYFEGTLVASAITSSVLLHELGHIIPLLILKSEIHIKPVTLGFVIEQTHALSYKQELLVLFCGPIANTAIAVFSLLLPMREFSSVLFTVNITLAAFNLLPSSPFDGGRIFEILSFYIFGADRGKRFFDFFSFLISFAFLFFSVYLLLFKEGGAYLFFVAVTGVFRQKEFQKK